MGSVQPVPEVEKGEGSLDAGLTHIHGVYLMLTYQALLLHSMSTAHFASLDPLQALSTQSTGLQF